MMLRNWLHISHLILALFEIASRARLSILIPDINTKCPIIIQTFEQFASTMEYIEEWAGLAREANKRFGPARTLCELSATITKTVANRGANSPYIKGILISNPRYFRIGRILPVKLSGVIFADYLVQEEFFNNIISNPEFDSLCNIELLRRAFPKNLKKAQDKLDGDITCLESLD